jgi:hypothetical protein
VRKTYEAMREEYGSRIVDYKVDNESSAPRVCDNRNIPGREDVDQRFGELATRIIDAVGQ